MAWEKGVAQTVDVPTGKDGILTAPSGTVTATIIKDGAGPIALNGTVVKIGTSPAVHLALSATDMNCNCGLVLITDPGLAIDDMPFSFATESEYSAARAGYLTGAVATAATQTTILARLGDFAGTGLNSAKGFLQAMFRKDAGVTGANTPSEINEAENTVTGAFDGTTDSQEAIRDTAPLGTAMRGTDGAYTGTPPTAAAIADAVFDEAATGHTDAGKAGAQIWTDIDAIAVDVAGLDGAAMRGTDGAELTGAAATAVVGLATAATQTTILARLGDFAGTGLNSAKGFLQAMFRKDAGVTGANTPSEINEAENTVVGGFDGTTDSQEAIRDRGDAAWITATGFATPTNVSDAQTAITNVLTAIKGAGWSSETLKLIYDSLPSAGSGAFPITLYVKDLSANPIQNAKVRINATGGDAVQTTNSLGVVTFNLDAGTYTAYVGTSASYTPAASYSVIISGAGAITSPAGGILTVTAISLPVPTSADNYLVYNNERKVEADVAFGAAGMTVKITDLSFSGRVDAAANACRSIIGTTYSTDAAGQWSFELAKTAFVAGAYLTIEKTWTDSSGPVPESQKAKLVAPATGATVAWADLSPSVV